MPLFSFEVLKPRTIVQLDLPLTTKFSDISEQILKYFQIDSNKYPNLSLKFIYRQIICKKDNTLESYDINPETKIAVYLPKPIQEEIANQTKSKTKKSELNPFLLASVNQELVENLTSLEFPRIDAIYSLAYQDSVETAVDMITLGISSIPDYRYHIDQIYSSESLKSAQVDINFDDIIRHDIELAKIIAKARDEDEEVKLALLATQYDSVYEIKDEKLSKELKELIEKVQKEKPGQIEALSSQYQSDGKSSIISLPQKFYEGLASNGSPTVTFQSVREDFNSLFAQIPAMTEDSFINPFTATYDNLIQLHPDQKTLKIYDYGKTLNYEQLKFIYQKFIVQHYDLNKVVDSLRYAGGDVNEAKGFLNGDLINPYVEPVFVQPNNVPLLVPRPSAPLPPVDEDASMRNIMSHINKALLDELVSYGFDRMDAIYAVIYHPDIDNAIEFIHLGIAGNLDYRYHINQIYNGHFTFENLVRNDIELSRIIARAKGENETIRIASNIMMYMMFRNQFTDMYYLQSLLEYMQSAEKLYGKEISEMNVRYMQSGQRPMINFPININTYVRQQSPMEVLTKRFNQEFLKIPSILDDNYMNPYASVYGDLVRIPGLDQRTAQLFEYGRNLNLQQLKFLYKKIYEEKRDMNEMMEYLILSDGNIDAAQALIDSGN